MADDMTDRLGVSLGSEKQKTKKVVRVGGQRKSTTSRTASKNAAVRASVTPGSPLPWRVRHTSVGGDVLAGPSDFFVAADLDHDDAAYAVVAANAYPDMLAALKTTAGNIRSLGPAGALAQVYEPYRVWLQVVEGAIAKAEVSHGR